MKTINLNTYYYKKSEIDDLLSRKANLTHMHGNITNDGFINNQASKNVVTDANGKITTEAKPTIPVANTTATNIKMNGTQSAGSLDSFAKADHVHPVDTSRAAASHTHSNYLTSHQDISGKENISNKTTTISSSSTDTQYPSAKAVYTGLSGKANSSHTHSNYLTSHQDISGKENTSNKTTTISSSSTDTQYPSAKATYTELNKKANSSHTHDDRYYTETEVDNKLNSYLTTSSATSSYQPKGNYVTTSAIKNDLTTGGASNVLSAEQGKTLKGLVDGKASSSHTHGNISNTGTLNSDTTTVSKVVVTDSSNNIKTISKIPSANVTHQDISGKINTSAIKNDLTTGGATNVLSAEQGKKLKAQIDSIVSGETATDHNHDGQYLKTGTGTVTSTNIVDGTIVNGDIANYTIGMEKLAVHAYGGTSGTAGYVKLLRFTITATYQDRPINFKIERRHATELVNCSVTFKGASNKDPDVGTFICSDEIGFSDNLWNAEAYLYKEDTSTWSLIVRKSENYDSVQLRELLNPNTAINVTKIQEFITTLPTSSTTNPLREIVCLNTMSEYIEGTHGTTATNVWTGTATKITRLTKGTTIFFKMTSAGTSTGATLNLTLANGYQTGAKSVYYNATTAFTTHLPVNTVLCLVYDGSKWINTAIQNTNNFDRLINGSQITAGEALTANTLVYARSNGRYYKIASGGTLDIRYPVIYNNQAIASGNNHYNNHNAYNAGVNIQNTLSGKTITAYQNCYLEGTLSNNIFTISDNVFVSDGATTNGKYYILLGMALNTTTIRFNSFDKTIYKCIDSNHTLVPVSNWNTMENKPSSFTPSSHSHGSLANGGTLNSDITSVNKIAVTDSSNNLKTISQLPYSKISGTPTIPTKTSQLTNDSNYIKTSSTSGYIKNDGTIGTPTNTTYSADESTLTKSSANVFSLKDSSNYVKKSSTSGYLKNDGTVGTPTNTDTHNALEQGTRINIGATVTANQLVGRKYSDGKYYPLGTSSLVIDASYPIFYMPTGTGATNGYQYPYHLKIGVNLQTTKSGVTITANEQVFVEGTQLSGNQFVVSSTVFKSETGLVNGYYYIPIGGSAGSTTNINFNSIDQTVYKKTSNGLIPVSDWETIEGKPTIFTPSSHTHGAIQNGGTLNSDTTTVSKAVVTDGSNNIKTISKIPFANLNITKNNITGLGIPASDTNTTYSKGDGLLLSGTTFSADFGTGNKQVARGDHNHSGTYANASHTHNYAPINHSHQSSEVLAPTSTVSNLLPSNLPTNVESISQEIVNQGINTKFNDTGLVNFPYNSNAQDSGEGLKIRKIGNIVTLGGIGLTKANISANGDLHIGTLSQEYRPPIAQYGMTMFPVDKIGFIKVFTDGKVYACLRSGTGVTVGSGGYFPVNMTWMVD